MEIVIIEQCKPKPWTLKQANGLSYARCQSEGMFSTYFRVVKIKILVKFYMGYKKLLITQVQAQLLLTAEFGTAPVPWVHWALGVTVKWNVDLLLVHYCPRPSHLQPAAVRETVIQLLNSAIVLSLRCKVCPGEHSNITPTADLESWNILMQVHVRGRWIS